MSLNNSGVIIHLILLTLNFFLSRGTHGRFFKKYYWHIKIFF